MAGATEDSTTTDVVVQPDSYEACISALGQLRLRLERREREHAADQERLRQVLLVGRETFNLEVQYMAGLAGIHRTTAHRIIERQPREEA